MSKELKKGELKKLHEEDDIEELYKTWERDMQIADEEAFKEDEELKNVYTYKIQNLIKEGSFSKTKVLNVFFNCISGKDIEFCYYQMIKEDK